MILSERTVRHSAGIFPYLQVDFEKSDSEVIDQATKNAMHLSEKVQASDPAGVKREKSAIYNRNLAGVLSEVAFRFSVSEVGRRISVGPTFANPQFVLAKDQIDVVVTGKGGPRTVEIRSSGFYKTSLERVFNGAFSIIGWYTTAKKPGETRKDFYTQMVYHFDSTKTEENVESGLSIIFASGASKELLKESGFDTDLKQYGATYRVINPLVKGIPPIDIVKMILASEVQDLDCSSHRAFPQSVD